MAAKLVAFSAFVASSAAFTPALSGVRTGTTSLSMAMDKTARAPIITVFDHRGCSAHKNVEYTGRKAGDQDDEMLVKVQSVGIEVSEAKAEAFLGEAISLKGKGIDGPYSFGFGFPKPN